MAILNKEKITTALIGALAIGAVTGGIGFLVDSYNQKLDEVRADNRMLHELLIEARSEKYGHIGENIFFELASNPTVEYPFDGLEGRRFAVPIAEGGSVWNAVVEIIDGNLAFDVPGQRETMAVNMVNELEEQVGRELSLVQSGDIFELDLRYVPSRNGTPVPFGASAPSGAVEAPPLTAENNPDFGMPFTEDPFEWPAEQELEIIERPEQISDGSVTYDPSEMTSPVEVAECDTPFPLEGDTTEYTFGECYLTELPR